MKLRRGRWLRGDVLRRDGVAGLVLGVESVPDGLASGLLAGVNPIYGLYGYMVGTAAGALLVGTTAMAVQATGAMSVIVADVDALHSGSDPAQALFTLSLLTGVVMLVAGLLRLGSVLRFVSRAVMVGFISAVGVNIVLGQIASATGYDADGGNRVARTLDSILHISSWDGQTTVVSIVTIVLIVVLERTRLGALGMVIAVVATSAAVALLGWDDVAVLGDIADVPRALPTPHMPDLTLLPTLLVPAFSLAFVGLVQGAGVAAAFPNEDGPPADPSRDFIGQGGANVACGLLGAMPVGGSMSATSLLHKAGGRSRLAQVISSLVMVVVVLVFAGLVEAVAMPALAALLILIGVRTVKPAEIETMVRAGTVQAVVVGVTFVLTLLIPLQYAVLAGVGLSVVLHVVRQSNRVRLVRWRVDADGIVEGPPPASLPPGEVVVLQPYGSLFFASAPVLEGLLPRVDPSSQHTVVILRLRGIDELGTTVTQVLARYAEQLRAVDSKLVLVSASERIEDQVRLTGLASLLEAGDVYRGDERVGATLRRAYGDAERWVTARRQADGE